MVYLTELISQKSGTMYPPHGDWDFGFPVQPIAIIMVPQGNDVLIESCKAEVLPDFKKVSNRSHLSQQNNNYFCTALLILQTLIT